MTRVLLSLLALAASFVATLSELSSNLTYIQIQCFDKKCSQDCDGGPVPQNECIGSTGACISVHAMLSQDRALPRGPMTHTPLCRRWRCDAQVLRYVS